MSYLIRRVLAKPHLILDKMCRLYGKFASYLRCVLCKTHLIFPRINGPIVCDSDWMCFFFHVWKTLFAPLIWGVGARINWHMKVYDVACHSTYIINNYERYLLEHTGKMIINIQVCFFTRNRSHGSLEWPYNIFSTVIIMG